MQGFVQKEAEQCSGQGRVEAGFRWQKAIRSNYEETFIAEGKLV